MIPKTDSKARRLTNAEKTQYANDGYVKNLPLFNAAGVALLQTRFHELLARLPDGVDVSRINCWHKANRWVYELSKTPALLDYVEDIIGPDFCLWGTQFFAKFPGDGTVVPWHQDAQYWPLSPQNAVTVWIAFFRTDAANAAMQVVGGSHKLGEFAHQKVEGEHFVLKDAIHPDDVSPEQVVTLDLEAGEISLHDDALIHGSGPNHSERTRAGLAIRYSPFDVRCDLSVWPNFESYPVSGEDQYRHNPVGPVPTADGFPTGMFQHSSEFDEA